MNKLCKDCKWFLLNDEWNTQENKSSYATCARTAVVDGKDGIQCRVRRNSFIDWCSFRGKQWEPK